VRAVEDVDRFDAGFQVAEGPVQQAGKVAGDSPFMISQRLAGEPVPNDRHELEDHVEGVNGNPLAGEVA